MAEEEKSTQNVHSCGRIISEMKEYFDLYKRSEEDIKKLMQQVENNTPLDGHCIQCPRIRIEPQA
ncbi:hypothetical protein MUP37_06945 [Candidatus Bathyarchaeota archaeon]|nr:hypothetical protein [Candidatus Bathyarchaeota archaeon]